MSGFGVSKVLQPKGEKMKNQNAVMDLRKKMGLTQEKFAYLLGVTGMTVWRVEHKKNKPSPLLLRSLQALKTEVMKNGLAKVNLSKLV